MAIFNMVAWGSWGWLIVPIDTVTNLDCIEEQGKATLTWTDPNDAVYNWVTLVSWTKSILVRKVGSIPTSTTDGTVLVTSTTRNEYSTNWFVDTWLSQSTGYYYAVFTVWDNGTVARSVYYYIYNSDYFYIKAEAENSYTFLRKKWTPSDISLETSSDGVSWSDYSMTSTKVLPYKWSRVYFRSKNTNNVFSSSVADNYWFRWGWKIGAYGNISYLLNRNKTNTAPDYCFNNLFNTQYYNLVKVDLELPWTSIWAFSFLHFLQFNKDLKSAKIKCNATTLWQNCFDWFFQGCSNLEDLDIKLPATTVAYGCYEFMFASCTKLTKLVKLPATTLNTYCYLQMYKWCSLIKLSSTKTWEYQTAYRIPTSWTWSWGSNQTKDMFTDTGWTFTWTPSLNTTYYTSNEVIW